MSRRHVPIRTCAVTHEKLPKDQLLRFVILKESGEIKLDEGQRYRGRGLNLKPSLEVFDLAVNNKTFNRVFESNFDKESLSELRNIVEESINRRFNHKKVVRISKEDLDKLKDKENE